MKVKKYNYSDAWLLLAIIYASSGETEATLERIVAIGDAINHSIFNADELESGLARLTAGKFIKEKNGIFSAALKVRRAFEKTASRGRTVEKELNDVAEFIKAAPPASAEQAQINNLKYPGFTDAAYRAAVDKHLSPEIKKSKRKQI